jgi:hypothetical protein
MKLSEYVHHLQSMLSSHGDIEVFQGNSTSTVGAISPASPPKIKEVAILAQRERNARTTSSLDGPEKHSGRMIVYVGY